MDYAPSPAEDPSASHIGHMNRPSPRSAFEARPSRTQIAPANPDAIYSESRHDVANPDAICSESRRDAGVTTLVAKPPSQSCQGWSASLPPSAQDGVPARPPAPHSPMRRGG